MNGGGENEVFTAVIQKKKAHANIFDEQQNSADLQIGI